MNEYVTATDNPTETIGILKRMISDGNYYKMYAQLNIATYHPTLNLDADALRVLIAHYSMPERAPRPAWSDPEPFDMPTPPRRLPEDMRE